MSGELAVARQLAALRRKGFGTLEAIALVAPALDPGPVRAACERAAERLRAGAAPGGDGELEAMLSRGDAASPAALECLAQSDEAAAGSAAEQRRAVLLFGTFVVGPLLLASLAGWINVGSFYLTMDRAQMPGPTRAVLALLEAARWAGLPLAVAVGLGLRALARRGLRRRPGFVDAASLFQLCGALELGHTEDEALALTQRGRKALAPTERHFLGWARGTVGLAAGARALADQKLADALARQRRFERWAPLLLYGLFGGLSGVALAALYQPLVTLAQAVRP